MAMDMVEVEAASLLEPLVMDILKEHFRKKCMTTLIPNFWKQLGNDLEANLYLESFVSAMEELKNGVDAMSCTVAVVDSFPANRRDRSSKVSLLEILESNLATTKPDHIYSMVFAVFKQSIDAWNEGKDSEEIRMITERLESVVGMKGEVPSAEEEEAMEESRNSPGVFLGKFLHLVSLLKSLNLLHFFADFAVADIIQAKVCEHVKESCSMEFDSPLLEETINTLLKNVVEWINLIYGNDDEVQEQWLPQVKYMGYKKYAELRISELFDILVEYPDSEPALEDLKQCMLEVNLDTFLISSLKSVFEKRLLHPGANTSDIITQYISSVKGLRLLDPSGVVLEQVCTPVRDYLKTREDTVRCIVASLTDYSSNELADELVTGEPVLLDLNEESDNEDQDFDAWEPDPVDADPSKTSKSRQTSDIISLLVSIYGSREMFVNEYRSLLADRLLQSLVYDVCREVRNIELLKLRFGESNLYHCEVMVRDIADSKRINSLIVSQLNKDREKEMKEPAERLEVNAFILSHIFWPTFREEKLTLPDFIQTELEKYVECYKSLKGLRTLEWKSHLGLVQVELELADRTLSLSVTPIRAAIIYNFQEKSTWSVDALSTKLTCTPSTIRRHLGYWVGQGVLREDHNDTFTTIERQTDAIKSCPTTGDLDDEEESAMVSADDQRESDFQVCSEWRDIPPLYQSLSVEVSKNVTPACSLAMQPPPGIFWSYVTGMLTSLGKMKLDRIYSMLKMFATPGAGGKEISEAELKIFLEKKVREQQLVLSGGDYQLP